LNCWSCAGFGSLNQSLGPRQRASSIITDRAAHPSQLLMLVLQVSHASSCKPIRCQTLGLVRELFWYGLHKKTLPGGPKRRIHRVHAVNSGVWFCIPLFKHPVAYKIAMGYAFIFILRHSGPIFLTHLRRLFTLYGLERERGYPLFGVTA